MLTRFRSRWLAGGGAVLLVMSLSGMAAAATLVSDSTDPVVTPGNNPVAGKIMSASDFGFTQTERVIQLGVKYSF